MRKFRLCGFPSHQRTGTGKTVVNGKQMRISAALLVMSFIQLPFIATGIASDLPDGFAYADRHIPRLVTDLKYFSAGNFVGKPIDGYKANRAILTEPTILALAKVQKELNAFGLGIKIYDAYRPQQSVAHFIRWSLDRRATETRQTYYPHVGKNELFKLGYINQRSGHSRGSTLDMTIIDLESRAELDMGSPFDLFDPVSRPDSETLTPEQRAHRLLLTALMQKYGFKPYLMEWWHFTLANEPFPDTYFNFPVE